MKSLLILAFLAISLIAASSFSTSSEQGIEMLLSSEIQFEEKVKVFDYDGNLLKEYVLSDVANDELSATDYFALQQSDFAFDYLGDYYYFTEELELLGAN